MKKKQYIAIFALTFGVMGLQSCLDYDQPTDDFNPNEISIDDGDILGDIDRVNRIDYQAEFTSEEVDAAANKLSSYLGMVKTAQYNMRGGKDKKPPVSHAYQLNYTLSEVYAQYSVVPHKDFLYGSELISSYQVSPSWNNGGNSPFASSRVGLTPLLNHVAVDTIPEVKAIALLLYNYAAIENVDLYGTMPYNDFKKNKIDPPFVYDDMKTIYTEAKANIDDIVKCFRYFDSKPEWYKQKVRSIVNSLDEITSDKKHGIANLETWARFANSLKLRMAMHIVKAEPVMAKQWAEEAVKDGVIDDLKYEIGIYPSKFGGSHPLVEISEGWSDLRLSASFVSLIKSLQHPYGYSLFMKNGGALFNESTGQINVEQGAEVIGIRSGSYIGKGQEYASNQYIGFSRLNSLMMDQAPLYLFKLAEIDFLRAEGALRNWDMGGTPEFFYNRGIDNSSIFEGQTANAEQMKALLAPYKEVAAPVAYTYKDPTGTTPDIESVTKIGVKWNNNDSQETKLEKIITQKYIALYPNGMEAWGEMRRTGYPKVFPVLNVGDGDGSLKQGDLVRRMLFPNDDDASLKDIQTTGLKALGGADQQATRVWWDVNKSNF